jgi:hypothetical protein
MFWFIFFTTEFGEELEFYAQQKLEDFATKAFLKKQNQMQKSQWKHEDSFLSCFLPSSRDKTKTQTSWLKLFRHHGWSYLVRFETVMVEVTSSIHKRNCRWSYLVRKLK